MPIESSIIVQFALETITLAVQARLCRDFLSNTFLEKEIKMRWGVGNSCPRLSTTDVHSVQSILTIKYVEKLRRKKSLN